MKWTPFLVLLLCALNELSSGSTDHHWHQYKEKHGKSYKSGKIESRRRIQFEANRRRVEAHNSEAQAGVHSYNLTLNHLADRPQLRRHHRKSYKSGKIESRRRIQFEANRRRVEAHNSEAQAGVHSYNLTLNHLADRPQLRRHHRKLTGLLQSQHPKTDFLHELLKSGEELPEAVDWRQRGFEMGPLNQGNCGSCYAFTMASVLEAQVFKENGSLVELSRQQLVDCTVLTGNLGCEGGSFTNTAKYLQRYGLLTRESYPLPYRAKRTLCRALGARQTAAGYRVKSWGVVPSGDESALAAAVALVGPLAVSVNASPFTFQLYHSGTYDDHSCTGDSLNHAMLLVGYTKGSWILKNWWSDGWGEGGYMRVRRGVNRCGIANFAVFLTIEQST